MASRDAIPESNAEFGHCDVFIRNTPLRTAIQISAGELCSYNYSCRWSIRRQSTLICLDVRLQLRAYLTIIQLPCWIEQSNMVGHRY